MNMIQEHGLDTTMDLLGVESTVGNNGWKAATITLMETLLRKKFDWFICKIHKNELGLCCLIKNLDGKTDSRGGFSDPLGKLLEKRYKIWSKTQISSLSLSVQI